MYVTTWHACVHVEVRQQLGEVALLPSEFQGWNSGQEGDKYLCLLASSWPL